MFFGSLFIRLVDWMFVQSQILGHPARHGLYRLEENGMT
jgi:hypothetical protein